MFYVPQFIGEMCSDYDNLITQRNLQQNPKPQNFRHQNFNHNNRTQNYTPNRQNFNQPQNFNRNLNKNFNSSQNFRHNSNPNFYQNDNNLPNFNNHSEQQKFPNRLDFSGDINRPITQRQQFTSSARIETRTNVNFHKTIK